MQAVSSDGRRWFGVGSGRDGDPAAAGRAAASAAVAGRAEPAVLLVFASSSYDLEALLAGVRAEAPGVPLAGCTTAGELSGEGPGSGSVVVVALGGEGMRARVAVGRGASTRQREAGASAAAAMAGIESPHRVLMLLTPGFAPHQEDVVRGAYSVTGYEVPIVGGAAGDDLSMAGSHQLVGGPATGDRVLSDCVVGVALGSDAPMAVTVSHGWRKAPGEPMVVSMSDGADVATLDDQPALDAYLARLEAPALGAVAFDCIGRRLVLGEGGSLEREVKTIVSSLGDVPVGGFYTYGEIARARGSSGLHNETLVLLTLA